MLVLTRKPGQAIHLGTSIRVVVLSIKGNNVRLGIEAPEGVKVHREEVYRRVHRLLIGAKHKQAHVVERRS